MLQNWQRRKVDIEPDQQIAWGAIHLKMAKNWQEDRYWQLCSGYTGARSQRKIPAQYSSLTRKQFLSFLPSGENFLP